MNYEPIALCDTKELDEQQWLLMRTGALHNIPCTIGGSDAAVVLDYNPWTTSQELYDRKSGVKIFKREKNKKNKKIGKAAEKFVQELFIIWFEENYRIKLNICSTLEEFNNCKNGIYNDTHFYRCGNPDYDFAVANLDGLIKIDGRIGILEYKTTSGQGTIGKKITDEWKNKRPPIYYITQCRHYMGVMNLSYAFLICAWELNITTGFSANFIERDLKEEQILFQTEKKFVQAVLSQQPWDSNNCDSSLLATYYSQKYGNSDEKEVPPFISLDSTYFPLLEKFYLRTEKKKQLTREIEEMKKIDDELISLLYPVIGNVSCCICKSGDNLIQLNIKTPMERFMVHSCDNEEIASQAGFKLHQFLQEEPILAAKYTSNVIDLKKLKFQQPQVYNNYQRVAMPTGEKSTFEAILKKC